MKDKTSEPSSRLTQVADELHKIADTIGAGQVEISGVNLSISDSVTLKVKQKMTGEKVVFDLKIQAHLADSEIEHPVKSGLKKKSQVKHKSSTKSKRPYGVKAQKKKYTGLWRQIAATIKKGEYPDATLVTDLEDVSKEYRGSAPPEWAQLWLEHETLVRQCVEQAQNGDFTSAQTSLTTIGQLKKNCHKQFK